MKEYKIQFQFWPLLLFILIMIPNIIWLIVPAPNDILRAESVTPIVDIIASISQVMMVAVLCFIQNEEVNKFRVSPLIIASIICLIYYILNWVIYYSGIANPVMILKLTLIPCLSFLFFALDRKNIIAIIPLTIFAICHIIFAIVNYIL